MSHHRGACPRATLLAVAAVALVASGCACMYGQCGGNNERMLLLDGQNCYDLEGSRGGRLGFEGAKLHRLGDGKDYYVVCFNYPARKGATLSIVVESSAFEPEVWVRREGEGRTTLASGVGERTARLSVTFPESGRYAVVVTSVRPGDTGSFDIRYSTGSR